MSNDPNRNPSPDERPHDQPQTAPTPSQQLPGDLAVTSDGRHALAYLGDRTWIHATSDVGCVARERAADSRDRWFVVPVQIVRWRQLTTETQAPPRSAPRD